METDRASRAAPEETDVAQPESANDAAYHPQYAPVRVLHLNGGATRVLRQLEDGKPDELWLGDATDPAAPDDPAIPVYMRLGPVRSTVAELVSGCMARALGLPAPEVFVVLIPAGAIRSRLVAGAQTHLCVATRDVGGATFTQLLNRDAAGAHALLMGWPQLGEVTAFDEWLANIDRNLGNLLYAANTIHIIDHAEGFGGWLQDSAALQQLTALPLVNCLAKVQKSLTPRKRDELLKRLNNWLHDVAARVDVAAVVGCAHTAPWHSPQQDACLIDFMRQRLPITHTLLCQQLGHPQAALPLPLA